MRKCRCCDRKVTERIIRCGFCSESVDQNACTSPYGKWFHTVCLREFKNFYSLIFRDMVDSQDGYELRRFRDHVLFEMIMRHDLRLLKKQWSLLVANKAVPLVIRPPVMQVSV